MIAGPNNMLESLGAGVTKKVDKLREVVGKDWFFDIELIDAVTLFVCSHKMHCLRWSPINVVVLIRAAEELELDDVWRVTCCAMSGRMDFDLISRVGVTCISFNRRALLANEQRKEGSRTASGSVRPRPPCSIGRKIC